MGTLILLVLIFIAITKLPRITTVAVFTMVTFSLVESGGNFFRTLLPLFGISAVMAAALQLSTSVGGARAFISHLKTDKKDLIFHALASLLIIFVCFTATILICWFLRYVVMEYAEYIGFSSLSPPARLWDAWLPACCPHWRRGYGAPMRKLIPQGIKRSVNGKRRNRKRHSVN